MEIKNLLLVQINMVSKSLWYKMIWKNKKGISNIIATLLLIVLTVVLVVIVWTVINSLVNQKITQSSACFGNFNTINLNGQYTCFNSTTNNLQFSLNIGDIAVDGVLVTISSSSQSKSITLKSTPQQIPNLVYYNGTSLVALPGENSAMTYYYNWSGSDTPNSVQIAPIIKGQQCATSDTLTTIDNCLLLS
jgi:flagellin-like protein